MAVVKNLVAAVVALGGHEYVDDLPVLVDGPVHVTPSIRDLHVGLVDEPAVTDRMATRSGGIREQWRETLDPPVDGDVVDLDPTLTEELFNIPIGEPVPQIPPHGQDDELRWEPKALER